MIDEEAEKDVVESSVGRKEAEETTRKTSHKTWTNFRGQDHVSDDVSFSGFQIVDCREALFLSCRLIARRLLSIGDGPSAGLPMHG